MFLCLVQRDCSRVNQIYHLDSPPFLHIRPRRVHYFRNFTVWLSLKLSPTQSARGGNTSLYLTTVLHSYRYRPDCGNKGPTFSFFFSPTLRAYLNSSGMALRSGTNRVGSPPPVLIAVMGMSGTGKTSFINAVTEKGLKVGHGLDSCE